MSSTFVSERGSTMRANVCNSTCFDDVTDTKLKNKVMLVEIMNLVFLMTCLMVFLAVFGAWRRKSRSSFLKATLWISYATSAALVPFILGLIQDAPFKNELLIIWGMLLLIEYVFPDSFSAYNPEDVTQWRMHYIQVLVKFLALALLWLRGYSKRHSGLDFVVMCLFTLIVFLKAVKRALANFFASPPSFEERAKLSEVYMASEHHLTNESRIDPVTMRGYNYMVKVDGISVTLDDVLPVTPSDPSYLKNLIERNDVVTLQKVWKCEGRLLTNMGDPDNKLKDICLSYSLLKILYLKCVGYALPVDAQTKARKLILKGLLSENENDHDRAFRVIEVELKLLYELIYTTYILCASPIFAVLRALEFVLSLAACGLSAIYISGKCDKGAKVWCFNLNVLVTYLLLGMITFADIAQMWMALSSEWVKAALIVHYVANKYCQNNIFAEKIIRIVCKPWIWKPWSRELGQYSLIESRRYGTKSWISYRASAINPDRNWDGQEERMTVLLSDEVKGGVLDSLRYYKCDLENVRRPLRHNDMYEKLPGVCQCEHEAQVILVWHIATSYCQYRSSLSKSSEKNYKIANDLSNYLAYVVAFAPSLLPGPHFEPQFQFRKVMKEARKAFVGCKEAKDRIRKLDELSRQADQTIVVKGALLGKELLQLKNNEDIWKTLAEFWSDMALCAATSGEVRAHLEKLANGGEFITHLWALVHHTGYRGRQSTNQEDVCSCCV